MRHGKDCEKAPHTKPSGGYLHAETDDGVYDVDGLLYCGRCHSWMGNQLPICAGCGFAHGKNYKDCVWLKSY